MNGAVLRQVHETSNIRDELFQPLAKPIHRRSNPVWFRYVEPDVLSVVCLVNSPFNSLQKPSSISFAEPGFQLEKSRKVSGKYEYMVLSPRYSISSSKIMIAFVGKKLSSFSLMAVAISKAACLLQDQNNGQDVRGCDLPFLYRSVFLDTEQGWMEDAYRLPRCSTVAGEERREKFPRSAHMYLQGLLLLRGVRYAPTAFWCAFVILIFQSLWNFCTASGPFAQLHSKSRDLGKYVSTSWRFRS